MMKQILSSSIVVSVVIPCYNNGQYIAQAIESVQNQTFNNWELIVVNDGSTDNSEEVISHYVECDSRICYVKQENKGAGAARNRGVLAATGEYICFLDADDWLAPISLKEAMSTFIKHPECRMFCMKRFNVDETTGKRTTKIFYPKSYVDVLIYSMAIAIIVRKSDYVEIGGFDETMKKGFEDWEFSIRFLYHNFNVIYSNHPLYYVRNHGGEGRVNDCAMRNMVSIHTYIYKKHIEKYVEYLGSPIMLYQYEGRLLPRLCKYLLNLKAKINNVIIGHIH